MNSPQFGNPVHCAQPSNDGLIYVCDRTNNRIQVFKTDGTYREAISPWKPNTKGDGSAWEIAFSTDPQQKFMYISDGANEKIHVFDRQTMKELYCFGGGGRQPGQFYAVHSIVTDSKGNIYTTETYRGQRVQKFIYKGMVKLSDADQEGRGRRQPDQSVNQCRMSITVRRRSEQRPFRRIFLRWLPCQWRGGLASAVQGRNARMISERDVEQYRETGYLVVPDVLDAALLARVRGALDRLVADASSVSAHTDVYDLEPSHTPETPKVRRIKLPHTHTPVFWELAQTSAAGRDPGKAAGTFRACGCKAPRSISRSRITARRWNGTRTGPSIPTPMTTCWRWA